MMYRIDKAEKEKFQIVCNILYSNFCIWITMKKVSVYQLLLLERIFFQIEQYLRRQKINIKQIFLVVNNFTLLNFCFLLYHFYFFMNEIDYSSHIVIKFFFLSDLSIHLHYENYKS
jgi:uncharacterized membrane protein